MKELKNPKSYEDQVKHLISYHGLTIDDHDAAIVILSSVNYYRLSAYGIGLYRKDDKERFIDGISLNHLFRLYQFDSNLRNLLIPVIEWIEIEFRTKIAYRLAMAYGSEGYRDPSHFSRKMTGAGEEIYIKTMNNLNDEIKRQANLPCVKHHNEVYGGHFPIWAAMELFTFGMVCSLYSVCLEEDQKSIAKEYNTIPKHLHSWMQAMLELRNRCAHYNRIYNMFFKQKPYLYKENKPYQNNKLFPHLLAMKRLAKHTCIWDSFAVSLASLMKEYPEAQPSFMGFPKNWETILLDSEEKKQ